MSEQPVSRTVPTPGAGTLTVLALVWLLAMLSSARQALAGAPERDPLTVTRAALELPQVISASLIAGIAVGLAAGNLLARFAPAADSRPAIRYAVGATAGLVTGLLVATPILLRYAELPSILALSGTVAGAAALGGLLSGVRHRSVVAAGAAGALGVFAVGLLERAFEGDLRHLFGAGESAQSVLTATGWVVLTASLVAGGAAGGLGFAYLRRCDPAGPRWPAYLVAGATPGLLVLLAEAVTRLGGARLFHAVSTASADDQAVLSYFHAARFNRALIVVFVGALVATFLLGRTLRPAAPAGPPEPSATDQPPERAARAEQSAGIKSADPEATAEPAEGTAEPEGPTEPPDRPATEEPADGATAEEPAQASS